jgi:cell division protein FtsQ
VEREIFNLRSIKIEGLHSYEEEYFLNEIGLELGMNILFISEERLNQRGEKLPRIRTLDLQRTFPDRAKIVVEERVSCFLLNYGGNFFLIDSDGIIFGEPQNEKELNHPCIVDETIGEIESGQNLGDGDAQFLFILLKKMPDEILKNISEVSYINGEVVMYTVDGVKILWGDDVENYQVKLRIFEKLPAIVADYGNVEYVDIRYGDNPVIKTLESGD